MNQKNQKSKGTALITGASTGIGATYADRLARRGFDLVLVARDQNRLDAIAAQLTHDTGANVETLRADLLSKSDLSCVEKRLREDVRITMLVNNAGMAAEGSLLDGDVEILDTMVQLNVVAVLRLTCAIVPRLVKQGSGTIINIASVLALAPELFNGVYSGTKAFVLNLSQSLNKEIGLKGIRVQVVLPGATRTAIWAKSGVDLEKFPPDFVMEVGELVDAALAGLDMGELVTIPPLQEISEWEDLDATRLALANKLSRSHAAPRYNIALAQSGEAPQSE